MTTNELELEFLILKHGLEQVEAEEVNGLVRRFERLRADFEPVEAAMGKEKQAAARVGAPDFNVFRILGVAHLEDSTHSPFLAALLDSEGSHG